MGVGRRGGVAQKCAVHQSLIACDCCVKQTTSIGIVRQHRYLRLLWFEASEPVLVSGSLLPVCFVQYLWQDFEVMRDGLMFRCWLIIFLAFAFQPHTVIGNVRLRVLFRMTKLHNRSGLSALCLTSDQIRLTVQGGVGSEVLLLSDRQGTLYSRLRRSQHNTNINWI